MAEINDGGRAFPVPELNLDVGMSLRDWLAGLAMQGIVAHSGDAPAAIGRRAYLIADAMLAARSAEE